MKLREVIQRVHWRALLTSQLCAAALFASWLYPPFAAAWKSLDHWFFAILDAYMRAHPGGHFFWALMNHRLVDYLGAAFFVFLFIFAAKQANGPDWGRWLARGIVIGVFSVTVLDVSEEWIFDFESPSPTLSVDGAFRLTEAVPWVRTKDSSSASFPGDHGTAVMLFSAALWFFGGRHVGLLAASAAVFLMLPRLFAGAHWLSDILVGSAVTAIVSLGLVYAFHLHQLAEDWVVAFLRPVIRHFPGRGTADRPDR